MIRGTIGTRRRIDTDERRDHQRYQLKLPINLHGQRWSRGILVNISRGGIRLRAQPNALVGQQVRVSVRSYRGGTSSADGKVVRMLHMPRLGGFAIELDRPGALVPELFAEAERLPTSDRAAFLASELRPTIELLAR